MVEGRKWERDETVNALPQILGPTPPVYTVMPNTHRRRRRDATVELSRVGGVYWALLLSAIVVVYGA